MNIEGNDSDAVTTPSRNGEPVISSTNQARANTRMLRPMLELVRPAIRRKKFLLFSGLRLARIAYFEARMPAIYSFRRLRRPNLTGVLVYFSATTHPKAIYNICSNAIQ
jgi:hypothetical protein